jgi:hypothetical protein
MFDMLKTMLPQTTILFDARLPLDDMEKVQFDKDQRLRHYEFDVSFTGTSK